MKSLAHERSSLDPVDFATLKVGTLVAAKLSASQTWCRARVLRKESGGRRVDLVGVDDGKVVGFGVGAHAAVD